MRILILEDEPIIACDLEDIVLSAGNARCTVASSVLEGLRSIALGIDFAILDVHLGSRGMTSFPVASMLQARGISFCFVSCSSRPMPRRYENVPVIGKPYRPSQISQILPAAA